MISLEGRVLPRLDEFMLRLGHLKVLCRAAVESRGSWRRILEDTAAQLTQLVPVHEDAQKRVSAYLFRKHLCPVLDHSEPENDTERFRYPNLVVVEGASREGGVVKNTEQGPPKIWWQDMCLSDPLVRSRVGAVSATGRTGSKTPLSHIADWAVTLELLGAGGEPSYAARLFVNLGAPEGEGHHGNPYIIGPERIVAAVAFVSGDFDLFVRLVPRLLELTPPIRKSVARAAFVDAVEQLALDAERDTRLSSNRRYKLLQQIRELEKAAARARKQIRETSTSWHRAASRMEMFVELGLLEKGRGGEAEKYEYIYYPTPSLQRAAASLRDCVDSQKWIEDHLASVVYGEDAAGDLLPDVEVERLLPPLVRALKLPTNVFPIDVLAQGIVWLRYSSGVALSLARARASIENLARIKPESARLGRGTTGSRAEFVTLELKKMEVQYGRK